MGNPSINLAVAIPCCPMTCVIFFGAYLTVQSDERSSAALAAEAGVVKGAAASDDAGVAISMHVLISLHSGPVCVGADWWACVSVGTGLAGLLLLIATKWQRLVSETAIA